MIERRLLLEVRAEGRTLLGPAIRYGDVSPSHRERFEPGSVTVLPDLAPTLGHRSGKVLAYGDDVSVEKRESGIFVSARLPRTEVAETALSGVRSGKYRGWSMEFVANREDRDAAGIRILQDAEMRGLALVGHPSYEQSRVEVRQGGVVRSRISYEKSMDCTCAGPQSNRVHTIVLEPDSIELADDVAATTGSLDKIIGSTAADTLRLVKSARGLAIELQEAALVLTRAGRDLREIIQSGTSIFARPLFDPARSVMNIVGGRTIVSRMFVTAVLYKWTVNQQGLEPVELVEGREEGPREPLRGIQDLEPAPTPHPNPRVQGKPRERLRVCL